MMKQIGILLAQMPFFCFAFAYESELSTRRRITKIAQPSVARFAFVRDSVGIREITMKYKGI